MKTSVHLIASLILAAVLYPFYGWKVLFILFGGILIDIDHYFWFIYKFKKFNLIECYNYFIEGMEKSKVSRNIGALIIFHTIEFFLIIIILSFYHELILIFTIGLLSHYLLDLIYLYFVSKRFIANHSIIYWIYKNHIQKI